MAEVKIYVTLKPALLDAQGKVVQGALEHLGFEEVAQVRVGKYIEVKINGATDPADVDSRVREMCEKLLANPVIEDYRFEVLP